MADFLYIVRLSPKVLGTLHGVVAAGGLIMVLRWFGISL